MDDSATKSGIISFTRSLAASLMNGQYCIPMARNHKWLIFVFLAVQGFNLI